MVVGNSMQPTLNSGSIVLINRLANDYECFDIVIVETPEETIIKRIIGTPGDTIQIKDGYVYVNGKQINDVVDIQTDFAGTAFEPLTLKEDEYFVLGDNRADSKDSRYKDIGPIKEEQIIGRMMFLLCPVNITSKK